MPYSPEINDFWPTLVRRYPKLEDCRQKLLEAGAVTAGLSGSGSIVYGIFSSVKRQEEAQILLQNLCPTNWKLFSCETLQNFSYPF